MFASEQGAVGPKHFTLLLAVVSSDQQHARETLATLRFAGRAKLHVKKRARLLRPAQACLQCSLLLASTAPKGRDLKLLEDRLRREAEERERMLQAEKERLLAVRFLDRSTHC